MSIAQNIKKVAVVPGENFGDKPRLAQFVELDQSLPLAAVIRDICSGWDLPNPDDFSLQFQEAGHLQSHTFITERNRVEMQNGNVLALTYSPSKMAQDILDKLNNQTAPVKLAALKQLSEMSVDNTFAQEFINKKGWDLLVNTVESGTQSGDALAFTLRAFVELMDHGIVSWDMLEHQFIKNVATATVSTKDKTDMTTLQSSLEILESIVIQSTDKYKLVEQEITPVSLIHHLQSSNPEIQKNAIALINALFTKADPTKRKKIADDLQTKQIRNVILSYVIQKNTTIGAEMTQQLYMLQTLMFSLLDERRMTKVEPNDQSVARDISELRKVAFDADSQPSQIYKRQGNAKDYTKLGFHNCNTPAEDFLQVPPGILALDNMMYFAKQHGESYTKVVLENSCRADEHDCPFAKSSIELTNMLCEILRVGEQPTEEGSIYYPMFFTHDKPFEEFYCICIQLLNKTWKEMRATSEDFAKVLSVVKEQVTRALDNQPRTFDQFKNKLQHLTYSEITAIWQIERRHKEEGESQARPIIELRDQIKPEMLELIKQQRLNCLVEGTQFAKAGGRNNRKEKFQYCRLSPNHKFFHHGDCEENTAPTIEQLPSKLAVVDIKGLATGKDCPHIKDRSKKSNAHTLAFSIITESEMGGVSDSGLPEHLNFIAPSEPAYQMWIDGINALLGHQMMSQQTTHDLETLLSMEIKLRLLDTEGVTIPENPPPIPNEPSNYDFAYNL